MKNTNNAVRGNAQGGLQQKPKSNSGYALPGDEDEEEGDEDEDDESDVGIVVNENVNPDDLDN